MEEEREQSLKNNPGGELILSAADSFYEEEIKKGWETGKKKTSVRFNRDTTSFIIDKDFFDIIKINEQERREAIEKLYGKTAARLSRMSTANS